MTPRGPNFDELFGKELEPSERERLRRVHDLLVTAGPPPELPPQLVSPPEPAPTRIVPRRRLIRGLALAAAVGVAAFGIGFLVGDRGNGPSTERVVAMSGTAADPGASASLRVFRPDAAGNWPMKLSVRGLAPSRSGSPYELWLTSKGRLAALCGSFRAEPDGTTEVPMNAPYRLSDFDGWVVVVEGSKTPLLTTA